MGNCLVCKSELTKFGKTGGYLILNCGNCGFGQTEKLKAQESKYHRDKSYIEEENLFKNIFQKRVDIICKFKSKRRILEIGCSTGLMLLLLKNKGWEVLGVEISKEAAESARKRGIEVIEEKFEDTKISEKFDLVIFNHTLEHMQNPVETIQEAKSLLNDDGLLYIDVPNFGGLSANLQGINWPLLLPNEHLWHFTLKSLEILLKSFGLKIIFVDRSSGIWDYGNPIKGILISLFSFKKRFFNEIMTAIPSWIITKLGVGSDLMVVAKKI